MVLRARRTTHIRLIAVGGGDHRVVPGHVGAPCACVLEIGEVTELVDETPNTLSGSWRASRRGGVVAVL